MSGYNDALQHFIFSLSQRYGCAPQESLAGFLQHFFRSNHLSAKAHLIEAGEIATEVYFIHSGILRVYYIDHNGNEVNQQFYQAGEVVAPLVSLRAAEPCPFYLQTLTESRVMVADYQSLYQAGKNNIPWLVAENAILRAVYLKTARREAQMLLGGAEQRYRWFLKENPELAQQLPLYQVASYLGVTPVSLSRLRKKLRQPNAGTTV